VAHRSPTSDPAAMDVQTPAPIDDLCTSTTPETQHLSTRRCEFNVPLPKEPPTGSGVSYNLYPLPEVLNNPNDNYRLSQLRASFYTTEAQASWSLPALPDQ